MVSPGPDIMTNARSNPTMSVEMLEDHVAEMESCFKKIIDCLYKIIDIHHNKAHAFLWLCALMNVRYRRDAQPSRPSVLYLVKHKLRVF